MCNLNLRIFMICAIYGIQTGNVKCEITSSLRNVFRSFATPYNEKRESRFLPLVTFVKWDQGQCSAPSGEIGNCVPATECQLRGGIAGGQCAGGYGICCVFMASCGGVARENGTYFVNPNHPETTDGTGSCQLTILKLHPEICQIRLDFEQFALAGPEIQNHICNSDQFLVSGGSTVPVICGISHGDHMYIDAGLGQSNPIILTTITSGPKFPRSWRIRISQIHCGSIYKADQGCLQYYTGVSGRLKSFNFDPSSGRQLSNQDYSICIRMERNFCSIQYTACVDPAGTNRSRSFSLSGNTNGQVSSMIGGGVANAVNSCGSDWLMIPCAKVAVDWSVPHPLDVKCYSLVLCSCYGNERANYQGLAFQNFSSFSPTDKVPQMMSCEDKICGGTFNAEISTTERTVSSNIRPFRLAFHTDSIEAPNDVDNRGFCLDYIQQPCTNG